MPWRMPSAIAVTDATVAAGFCAAGKNGSESTMIKRDNVCGDCNAIFSASRPQRLCPITTGEVNFWRSEVRRVGQDVVSQCRTRWSTHNKQKKEQNKQNYT